jgi:hypothetical protein
MDGIVLICEKSCTECHNGGNLQRRHELVLRELDFKNISKDLKKPKPHDVMLRIASYMNTRCAKEQDWHLTIAEGMMEVMYGT